MKDIGIVKKNISKMIDSGATDTDIESYVSSEGLTQEDVVNYSPDGSEFKYPDDALDEQNGIKKPFMDAAKDYIKTQYEGLSDTISANKFVALAGPTALKPGLSENIKANLISSAVKNPLQTALSGFTQPEMGRGVLEAVTGTKKKTISEALGEAGMKPGIMREVSGLAIDIATDPTAYLVGGSIKGMAKEVGEQNNRLNKIKDEVKNGTFFNYLKTQGIKKLNDIKSIDVKLASGQIKQNIKEKYAGIKKSIEEDFINTPQSKKIEELTNDQLAHASAHDDQIKILSNIIGEENNPELLLKRVKTYLQENRAMYKKNYDKVAATVDGKKLFDKSEFQEVVDNVLSKAEADGMVNTPTYEKIKKFRDSYDDVVNEKTGEIVREGKNIENFKQALNDFRVLRDSIEGNSYFGPRLIRDWGSKIGDIDPSFKIMQSEYAKTMDIVDYAGKRFGVNLYGNQFDTKKMYDFIERLQNGKLAKDEVKFIEQASKGREGFSSGLNILSEPTKEYMKTVGVIKNKKDQLIQQFDVAKKQLEAGSKSSNFQERFKYRRALADLEIQKSRELLGIDEQIAKAEYVLKGNPTTKAMKRWIVGVGATSLAWELFIKPVRKFITQKGNY